MNYIELFAGCGGLSLGLKAAGFNLVLANEKSSMAAETFSYNLLGKDLKKLSKTSPLLITGSEDFKDFIQNFCKNQPSLHVGDILDLVKIGRKHASDLKSLEIDLVSGGPPCQGFSLAGKRKERDPKNKLPYSFLDFVHLANPRFVILENVLGITQAFKKDGGIKYPWFELAKAFISRGYIPFCFIVNARDFGVPQNRPRFIMFAVRSDIKEILKKLSAINERYNGIIDFSKKHVNEDEESLAHISINGLESDGFSLINLERDGDLENFGFQVQRLKKEITTSEAIEDLMNKSKSTPSSYVQKNEKLFGPYLNHPPDFNEEDKPFNFEERKHSDRVRNRFTFLQVASNYEIDLDFSKLEDFLANSELVEEYFKALVKEDLINHRNGKSAKKTLEQKLTPLTTKKHSQTALKAEEPAPAQLTIPDDYCHYSLEEPRVLTVREMARIQTFPDSFVFRSKVTTGGLNRRTEVPQYTQVGNAVPPLLGYNFGKFITKLSSG